MIFTKYLTTNSKQRQLGKVGTTILISRALKHVEFVLRNNTHSIYYLLVSRGKSLTIPGFYQKSLVSSEYNDSSN